MLKHTLGNSLKSHKQIQTPALTLPTALVVKSLLFPKAFPWCAL